MEDEGPQKNVLISLQPFDNFTQKEAESLQKDLEKNLSPLIGDIGVQIEILPNKPLSDDLKNDTKSRYRADKIINSLEKNANKKNIIIGLTHHDVSITYKGHQDWGVLGLSRHSKKACVVSTFRLRNRRDLWRLTTHEFIHTYFKYAHCPEDNNTCIMKDAKGHADFSNKSTLCKTCKENIIKAQ